MSTPNFDERVPLTASPEVEFVTQVRWNPSTELNPVAHRGIDREFGRAFAKAVEDAGFDYTLVPYFSNGADSFVLSAAIGAVTERLKPVVAVRPNHTFPLVVAQKLATLDQLTKGRAVVHLISGGVDAEQRRQGDYLDKDTRYARTSEFVDLLRLAWTAKEPVSHDGTFYKFDDFGPGFATYSGEPIPISIGGQSDAAFEVGAKTDWFTFNSGEPIAQIRADIDRVHAAADKAGRAHQRVWVTFRPVVAQTDELAWQKAYEYLGKVRANSRDFAAATGTTLGDRTIEPESAGAARALEFAAAAERYDRALWNGFTSAGSSGGASTALVGSYETVAAAILDYVDAGASIVSIRGYDTLQDVIDYGRHVLPLVRQELTHRKTTGRRGDLQRRHLGYYSDEFVAAAQKQAALAGV